MKKEKIIFDPKRKQKSEKNREKKLRLDIKKMGGVFFKWVSPGNPGVPDRIALMPWGKMYLVEVKKDGGKFTPSQKIMIPRIEKLNITVYKVVDETSYGGFLKFLRKEKKLYDEI